ncbi:MAG: pilus assembly protein PilZ [Solimicrobium sp.]|jgi:type IV pilus assembly protein PilZ|nr:pilus assembly protein PilZ [Solimicrobium sp.]
MKEKPVMIDTPLNVMPSTSAALRPPVLSLVIREKESLHAAYMPFLKNSGIFVPTSKGYHLGEEVYLVLTLLGDSEKYSIAGKVAWVTPSTAGNGKSQGIGVHFADDESGTRARQRIEDLLGAALHSTHVTHTL